MGAEINPQGKLKTDSHGRRAGTQTRIEREISPLADNGALRSRYFPKPFWKILLAISNLSHCGLGGFDFVFQICNFNLMGASYRFFPAPSGKYRIE